MKRCKVIFTRELTQNEKQELLNHFKNSNFCLNDAIKNGLSLVYQFQNTNCIDQIKNYYSKFNCNIVY